MINRRLIRIKVFKELFSRVSTNNFDIQSAKNELQLSLQRAKELYMMLLSLPLAFEKIALSRLEVLKQMFNPPAEEIDIHNKFLENKYLTFLHTQETFIQRCADSGYVWDSYYESALKSLYNQLIDSSIFHEYSLSEMGDKDSMIFFERAYTSQVADCEPLVELLEEKNIWWREDFEFLCGIASKNIKKFFTSRSIPLDELSKDAENESFGEELLSVVLQDYDDFSDMVSDHVSKWELDRLVLSDMIIISMGLAEVLKFADIPPKTTINECVEISKYYGTPSSHNFVNGVLNKIIRELEASNAIVKTPKGQSGMLTK